MCCVPQLSCVVLAAAAQCNLLLHVPGSLVTWGNGHAALNCVTTVACCAALQLQADRATAAVNLEARYQVPPHLLFELLADPTQHDKIFDAILVSNILGYQCQQCYHSLQAEIPSALADV